MRLAYDVWADKMTHRLTHYSLSKSSSENVTDFKSSKSAYVFSTPADKKINVEADEKDLVDFYKRYLFA